jgi:DNA-binding Lrp family transcriptional regulator
MIHDHSRKAYHEEGAKLSKRARQVLDYLELHPRSTDREIMRGLGFVEPNSVRPRVTELIDAGALVEVAAKQCPYTLKTVRIVDLSLDEKGRRQDRRMAA